MEKKHLAISWISTTIFQSIYACNIYFFHVSSIDFKLELLGCLSLVIILLTQFFKDKKVRALGKGIFFGTLCSAGVVAIVMLVALMNAFSN